MGNQVGNTSFLYWNVYFAFMKRANFSGIFAFQVFRQNLCPATYPPSASQWQAYVELRRSSRKFLIADKTTTSWTSEAKLAMTRRRLYRRSPSSRTQTRFRACSISSRLTCCKSKTLFRLVIIKGSSLQHFSRRRYRTILALDKVTVFIKCIRTYFPPYTKVPHDCLNLTF